MVKEHNPAIEDVNFIVVGQKIAFPSVTASEHASELAE
jgi:hypothetical protein